MTRGSVWSGRFVAVVVTVCGLAAPAAAAEPVTERVNVSSTGEQAGTFIPANGHAVVSADGRFVAFGSWAGNLVAGDTNETEDVFVRDRVLGQTQRVNVSPTGAQSSGGLVGDISANGRFVSFISGARNLVPGDTNRAGDVFVRDTVSGRTERVSVSSTGGQANDDSFEPAMSSPDGRFVVFSSLASNLVAGDTNQAPDVFVHNRSNGRTRRVNVSSAGTQDKPGCSESCGGFFPGVSADGRFVVFGSPGSNLVPGDTNGQVDVFVRDRETRQTRRVSVSSAEAQANGASFTTFPGTITPDGRFVAFTSKASDLVANDTNGASDAFVRDRVTGQTQRVNVSSTGEQATRTSRVEGISADGRFVVFASNASNLVAGDTNRMRDVFMHDRVTGQTQRLSVSSTGAQGNQVSSTAAISDDGSFVTFHSGATNLVEGDTNSGSDVFIRGPLQ